MGGTKHTPTPWRVVRRAGETRRASVSATFINGPSGSIAKLYNNSNCEADAEFIARAVNAHDALVDELRSVLSWARTENAPLRAQEIASIERVLAQASAPSPAQQLPDIE